MLALLLALVLSDPSTGAGPQNPGVARYNYGPSVLWNSEALKWQAWWCGPRVNGAGANVGGDAIWYADSADAATWSAAQMVLQPSASGWDSYHVCDPSVLRNVKLAGVTRSYVMYYTGADGLSGGDNDGRIGVAWSSDGIAWTRVQQLTLQCQSATSYGCQHFSAIKLRENQPDPAFGGRYVAIYSQNKTDGSSGAYAVESPDGISWWGNAGVPGSAPRRLTYPAFIGHIYMTAGTDLMYDSKAGRYLLAFTFGTVEFLFSLPARWYGGLEGSEMATQEDAIPVTPEGTYVPGFFRATDGYRPWSSGASSWRLWTMTSDRPIRDANGYPQETQLIRVRWNY